MSQGQEGLVQNSFKQEMRLGPAAYVANVLGSDAKDTQETSLLSMKVRSLQSSSIRPVDAQI
ncbi:MAG: hypothetical protein LQ342_007141 [Letrouitia transgressa]|nr:MAG: hypothetical protein LQ342_007141 [Letrouitia transgressa]